MKKSFLPFYHSIIFDESKQAPSPSKDYINLKLNLKEVHWTCWKIDPQCLRNGIKLRPNCVKVDQADFLEDYELKNNVLRVFGKNVLIHVTELCRGNYNYFCKIPDKLQMLIIDNLELEDILNLAQASKHFHKLCNSEQVWERISRIRIDNITDDMNKFASSVGWKKLRAQIRRHQKDNRLEEGDY